MGPEEEEGEANFSPGLEDMLTNKIGYGKAQYKMVIPLLFLLLNQGAQMQALGLLLPVLKKQWNISTLEESLGLTIINVGVLLGPLVIGYSDKIGRSPILLINAVMTLVFGLLSAISWNYPVFVITRFFISIGIGTILPLLGTYTAEIAPAHARGHFLSSIYVLWPIGYILSIVLAYIFFIHNQWRLVCLILCVPALLALLTYFGVGRETLTFLWAKKETVQAHKLIN